MSGTDLLGEFEQLVLLAILQNKDQSFALPIRQTIEDATQRPVSRGALYRTLDRMEEKHLLSWSKQEAGESRGGHPKKRFAVTAEGLAALQRSRSVVKKMSEGLEGLLEQSQ